MPFGSQQIYPIDLNASKAVGVDIPFNGLAVFKSNYLTKDAIKNNLINFFLTNPGERYLNPLFGAGLRAFIFEQISAGDLSTLSQDIEDKINLYFPNVKVEELEVSSVEDSNVVNVSLTYSVINTNISDNIEIEL
jgi:phage baseplate assembly protein W